MKNDKFKGEDAGFAINGGRGWSNVLFNNHKIDLNGPTAQAMGDYVFTDSTSGDEVRVEYTFGYKRNDDGKVRIYLVGVDPNSNLGVNHNPNPNSNL